MSFYKTNDVAEILGVNPETVRRWIREGQITCTRGLGRGGSTISDSQLREFVDGTNNHNVKRLYKEYMSRRPANVVKVTKLRKHSVKNA